MFKITTHNRARSRQQEDWNRWLTEWAELSRSRNRSAAALIVFNSKNPFQKRKYRMPQPRLKVVLYNNNNNDYFLIGLSCEQLFCCEQRLFTCYRIPSTEYEYSRVR